MYLNDNVQVALRQLGKISEKEVVKKQGDIYVAVNVLTNESRILENDTHLIESLSGGHDNTRKRILKG